MANKEVVCLLIRFALQVLLFHFHLFYSDAGITEVFGTLMLKSLTLVQPRLKMKYIPRSLARGSIVLQKLS